MSFPLYLIVGRASKPSITRKVALRIGNSSMGSKPPPCSYFYALHRNITPWCVYIYIDCSAALFSNFWRVLSLDYVITIFITVIIFPMAKDSNGRCCFSNVIVPNLNCSCWTPFSSSLVVETASSSKLSVSSSARLRENQHLHQYLQDQGCINLIKFMIYPTR